MVDRAGEPARPTGTASTPLGRSTLPVTTPDVPDQGRKIVVGVDGSPGSTRALAWAMGQARTTAAPLEAVIAWQDPVVYGVSYTWTTSVTADSLETIAEKALAACVAQAAQGLEQPAPVLTRVVNGDPAHVLLDAAAGAQLLVVGSRGHSALAGVFLGSVSQHLCQRAPCPVVVVPALDR